MQIFSTNISSFQQLCFCICFLYLRRNQVPAGANCERVTFMFNLFVLFRLSQFYNKKYKMTDNAKKRKKKLYRKSSLKKMTR